MKKLIALLLTIAMIFALCACDLGGGSSGSTPADGTPKNTEGSSQGGTQETSKGDEPPQTDSFSASLLEQLGLMGVVPADATKKEVDTDLASFYMGSYIFHVPVKGDANTERMEYANQVLSVIQSVSDDGKAYQDVYTADFIGWIIAETYTTGLPSHQLPGFYFYKDGKVINCNVYDYGNDTEHKYQIDIGKEADDYIKYGG